MTKQSHQLPGLCLCSVFFASCNKLQKKKKDIQCIDFQKFICIFDFCLFLIFEVHVQVQAKIKMKNVTVSWLYRFW